MNPTVNSSDAHVEVEFPGQVDGLNRPMLLPQSHARSKSSLYDELRKFQICLKWCALDHSTLLGKLVSYITFALLTIVVPVASSLAVRLPAADPTSINKLVHLPESGLATIAFFTLSRFFKRYGLRQLLFLDGLQEDSHYVQRGYTRELDKAFRHLACILLPSFFVELAHKIVFFSTVTIFINSPRGVPSNSLVFVLVLASWVYRTGLFLLVCFLFRLTCELQILRFEGFYKLLEGYGSDAGVIFEEHLRIKKQLLVTSHRYRFFIIGSLFTITVSQLGALFLVLASKFQKSFFNSGDLVVCSAVQLSGFFLCLLGAARITHRAQRIVSAATRWHMLVTRVLDAQSNQQKTDQMIITQYENPNPNSVPKSDSSTGELNPSSFHTRQALVIYLQHNSGGITLFGFALDRGLLHTLFAFEFSLVLWILSKVVVLS
ncbi:uncharacterized protein LOC127796306 [Diospyros lotus]|uniref:uncharacterized protein LOC127796306 n=1 Tax=Diospyros lotus TaxID=55363 RepID=UPI00224F43E8|nr:uncharacterized protein LOC127796306 [Diospyros lotus]